MNLHPIKLKRVEEQADKERAKNLKNCLFCQQPLLQKNYRDAVKDHCHITGEFRGVAHSACNNKLRINPKTMPTPVVFTQPEGLRRPPFNAGDVAVQKGFNLHRQQHGEIHHVYNGKLETYRQFSIFAE